MTVGCSNNNLRWFRGGERNRALTVVKSRGTGHSNQVREFVLSAGAITLADVYTEDGEVLMGTLRDQKEGSATQDRRLVQLLSTKPASKRGGSGMALVLYVAGDGPYSRRARANLQALMREAGIAAEVTVVDVLKSPDRALEHGIFATPALIVVHGKHETLIMGDLSERDTALEALLSPA